MRIEPFEASRHLEPLQTLINRHLAAVLPGWGLPPAYIESRLHRNPDQTLVDPWVAERTTFCAVEQGIVVAGVHLRRYGTGPGVSADYRGIGEVAWALHFPGRQDAGVALLREARLHLQAWGVRREGAGMDLAVPALYGVPDTWPHVVSALRSAGFRPVQGDYLQEAIRCGPLPAITGDRRPPRPDIRLLRRAGSDETRFCALAGDQEIGYCECRTDLTRGGVLPGLGRWAEIADFGVDEGWRGRGIGTWLLTHACAWLDLAGRDRVVVAVTDDAEGDRAGRLYDRFGWPVVAREDKAWVADAVPVRG